MNKTTVIVIGAGLVLFYLITKAQQAAADITNAPANIVSAGLNGITNVIYALSPQNNAAPSTSNFYQPL